jgi:hypothetical protein
MDEVKSEETSETATMDSRRAGAERAGDAPTDARTEREASSQVGQAASVASAWREKALTRVSATETWWWRISRPWPNARRPRRRALPARFNADMGAVPFIAEISL